VIRERKRFSLATRRTFGFGIALMGSQTGQIMNLESNRTEGFSWQRILTGDLFGQA
jgi:hypothetical protein